ncbi:MAG: TIGR00303 family protein [Thaumarchaeota archaeon]|nr:TIGR00303 family protein [Nitrososphaerota archaeon]
MRTTDLLFVSNKTGGKEFAKRLVSKNPLFVCVIGTTETAKIPNISAAGKNPNLTDYTPPADAEILLLGRCKCIRQIPVTPEGIPTPAIITRSAIQSSNVPSLIVDAGSRIKPMVPFVNLDGSYGKDIRSGKACKDALEIFQNAKTLGEQLSKLPGYLVIGESIPGGTTTALAVLLALGIDAIGRVSSSMSTNPHSLKTEVAKTALKAAGIEEGSLVDKPIQAVSKVGDPVLAAIAGLAVGATGNIPVMLAGGTQMGAALSLIHRIEPRVSQNLAIGTTSWLAQDPMSDLVGIIKQISDVPILAANLDFGSSRFQGLRAYEEGVVKEGVGAGGAIISTMIKSNGSITRDIVLKNVERGYAQMVMERK